MDANTFRQFTWLWENRHHHDDDPDVQEQITIINNTIGEVVNQGTGSGAYLHLTRAATQSIDATGELVEWDTEYSIIPAFEFVLSDVNGSLLPLTEITIPKDGYYNIAVQLGWDSFDEGGTVKVFRNPSAENEQVWPPADDPGIWTATDGLLFDGEAPAIPFSAGETLGVWVSPDDASAQDLASATLAVYLVDRATRSLLYHQLVLASGPVGYWMLDETAGSTPEDSSGNGHDGTYISSPTLGAAGVMADGSGSTSVDFNGSSHYVTIPQAAVDGLTDLSVEAWIYAETTGDAAIFFVNYPNASEDHNRWALHSTISGPLRWAEGGSYYESDETLAVLTPYYVAATRTAAGELKLYVNGQLDSTHSVTPNISASGDTVQIGIDNDVDPGPGVLINDPFDGRIDEVALYDRVLTAVEIEKHYYVGSRFV